MLRRVLRWLRPDRSNTYSNRTSRVGAPAVARRTRQLRVESLESRQLLSTLPAGFQETLLATNLNPAGLDIAPDGRIFVANKSGTVTIVQADGTVLGTPYFSVAVDTYRDRGLDAVLVDPEYATNHYVYVLYTAAVAVNPNTANNGAITRLVRLTSSTANLNVADPASTVVLVDNIPSPTGILMGGFLHFGNDGMLYAGIGSGDIVANAQDLSNLYGKVLRLDVRNYPNMIPADNPFVGQSGKRGEIWAYGFRNPFSGNINLSTNDILVNDVGSDQWEEIDRVVKGGNYGWPLAEGDSSNTSFVNPLFTYPHNNAGAAAIGGAFDVGTMFPSNYLNQYFVGDLVQGLFRVIDPATGQATVFASNVTFPTGMKFGLDGALYYTTIAPAGNVYKITYVGNVNRPPNAIATADVTNGLAPLTVNFSGSTSTDPDGDPLTYAWNFGDGTTGSGVTVQHTYTVNGNYNAVLTVTDTGGLPSATAPLVITVGNRAPVPTITAPLTTDKYTALQTIVFSATATDPDDGPLPASAFHWSFKFGHNTHFHDFIGPIDGVTTGNFVADAYEVDPDQYYRIFLTVTDSGGLSTTTFRDIHPVLSTFTLASNLVGASLLLDSQPIAAGTTTTGVVGMTRLIEAPATQIIGGVTYAFVGWSDGGAAQHNISTPAVATTYTALYGLGQLTSGFQQDLVADGLYEPTAMAVAPDGRVFVAEKPFGVRIVSGGQLLATPFLSLSVERSGERGVLGVTLDPNFAANGFVYVYYTHFDGVNAFDRLSRFKVSSADPNVADPASELPLIDGIPTVFPGWYNGGLLQFGADGMLYVGIGDTMDTTLPQDLSKLQGKILRINPAAYPNIIPSDNPFVGTPGARGEIWALGFHNPATGTVLPGTSRLFVNDLGNGAYSEVDEVVRGGNYGWPLAEGPSGNAGLVNPTYGYPSTDTQPAVLKGSVFYAGANFPSSYVGKYFFGDFVRGFIHTVDLQTGVVAPFDDGIVAPIDIENSPDGNLYWLSHGGPGGTPAGAIYKIQYVANRPPTAAATANPTSGSSPLTVNFDGSGSSDPDGDSLTWSWDFGDGQTGTGAQVTHTYANNGVYAVKLTVSDATQSSLPFPLTIRVGSQPPAPVISLPVDGAPYRGGQPINLSGSATDPEDGALPASALEWKVDFYHDAQVQSFISSIPGTATISFTPPVVGENSPNQFYRVYLTATDSTGKKTTVFTDVLPQTSTFTLATNPAGGSLLLDGQAVAAPITITGVVGMSRTISAPATRFVGSTMYQFSSWSDAGAATHTISTPATATTYVATYQAMALAATYVSNPPTEWIAGKSTTYQVTATNVGTQTWAYSGTNRVRLGVYFGGDSDAVGAWPKEPQRFAMTRNIAPGQSFTFNVTIAAPTTPGNYILRDRLVKENVAWFDTIDKINVTVGTLAANYSGTPPTTWTVGQTQSYAITVTNTGSAIWRATGPNRVRLGAWFGGSSDTPPTGANAPIRFDLPFDVAPGASATLTITITAPLTAGKYTLRHRLVHEWAGWFPLPYQLKTSVTVQSVTINTLLLSTNKRLK
jgi:glucose/arabinose dehydrogenase